MNARRSRRSGNPRGLATASALVLLLVFTSLGVAVCLLANTGLAQSHNHKQIQAAHMQAESGLSYLRYVLTDSVLPLAGVGQDTVEAIPRSRT